MTTAQSGGAPELGRLFHFAPGCCVVLTQDLVVVAVSDAYLKATMTRRESLVGRQLFEAFTAHPDGPPSSAEADLRASVARVVATGCPDTLPVLKYNTRRANHDGSALEERYWRPRNIPIHGQDGSVEYVMHAIEDVYGVNNRIEWKPRSDEMVRHNEMTAKG